MSEASLLLSLPDDVLKLVMQHVPPRDRLQHACLVSRRLHAAAIAGTDAVWALQQHQAAPAIEWLARYGQHVTRLYMNSCPQPLRDLPCPDLLDLCLHSTSSVQLGPPAAAGGGPAGVLQACTGLTSLEVHCRVLEGPEGVALDGLSHLVGLRKLEVWPYPPLTHGLSAATLPRLTQLTSLEVRGLSLENLGQLGALSSLQHLALSAGDVAVGPGSVPGLAFPAALTSLELQSPVEAGMFSLLPTGLLNLHVGCDVVGPAQLFLSGIARVQQLTALALDPLDPFVWPPAGPAYSALTASSSLGRLYMESAWLPEGVWPFVFPAAHTLPHLTLLSLCDDSYGVAADPAPGSAPWGPTGLANLVRCCPNLRSIYAMHLEHGEHVSELQKLSALSALQVIYGPTNRDEFECSLRHLGAVTQLTYLYVAMVGTVGVAALLQLTQLKGLRELQCGCQPDGWHGAVDPHCHVSFENEQAAGADPDVYIQLLEHCAKAAWESNPCSTAAAQAMASLTEVSARQRQAAADSRSLVAHQEKQLLEQQQLIAAQQQRISALLQVQSQPGQAAAGQADLVASLQEQLQQQSLLQQ